MVREWLLGGVAAACVALLGLSLAVRIRRRRSTGRPELLRRANRSLEDALPPGVGTHLEGSVRVRRVAAVENADEDRVVPVVRVPLGTTDAPTLDLAFEYVATVVAALHPVFADESVARYDVEFAFGPGGLIVSSECARVSIPPALADRLVDDPTYRARDLRRDATDADRADRRDEDGETVAPVVWGECRSYR